MIQTILQHSLGRALLVLPIVILGNILFGVALAELNHDFDRTKLKQGAFKGLLIYVGIGLFAIVSHFSQDLVIDFNGASYTLVDAMYVIVWGAVLTYSLEAITKLSKLFNYKVEGEE